MIFTKKSIVRNIFLLGLSCGVITGCQTSKIDPDSKKARTKFPGTGYVDFFGYKDCLKLYNKNIRVILGLHCGGRVLEYSRNNKNIIYLDQKQKGWIPDHYPKEYWKLQPTGGRFDIGPEDILPPRPILWAGPWRGNLIGPRKARLVSKKDPRTGFQLTRIFELDEKSSRLRCTQIIKNVSHTTRSVCYWGRTFVPAPGTCIIPLTKSSRFPLKYTMRTKGSKVWYRPKDENIEITDKFAIIKGPPQFPELGFDSMAGWLAYCVSDLLFIKKFPVYEDRNYSFMIPMTVCIYYTASLCELEPIGPAERLQPGQSASYYEDWWLKPYKKKADSIDPEDVARQVP